MEKEGKFELSGRKWRRGGNLSYVEGNGEGEENGVEWMEMDGNGNGEESGV